MSEQISRCPVCGKPPKTFSVRLAASGGLTHKTWVTECEGSQLEDDCFIEHRVDVYGNTAAESESRWQEMACSQNA